MRRYWQFHRGDWTLLENPFEEAKRVKFGEWIKECGYAQYQLTIGPLLSTRIEAYERSEESAANTKWEFWLEIDPGGRDNHTVLVTDLPSLLLFLRNYADLFKRDR